MPISFLSKNFLTKIVLNFFLRIFVKDALAIRTFMLRIKSKVSFVLFIGSALFLSACSNVPEQNFGDGKTFLWKVADKNSHVWILGSIHYADSSFYPLPRVIENAFSRSAALAVEMNINDEQTIEENEKEIEKKAYLPKGQTLKSVLPDSVWNVFDSVCQSFHLSPALFQTYRPWMAATALSAVAIMKSGLNPEAGIDVHFLDKATELGKEIIALETPAEQISALTETSNKNADDSITSDDSLSIQEGIYYLHQTLIEIQMLDSMIMGVAHAWKTGNIQDLQKQLRLENVSEETEKNLFETNMEKRLFTDRNKKMFSQIENFLKDDREVFIVIGAAHLIYGKESVLSLLRAHGFSLERF